MSASTTVKTTTTTVVVPGLTADMIPAVIGKGGSNIKKVKSHAWRMWDSHDARGEGVGENKPKLRIHFEKNEKDNTVIAQIETESENMRKFCYHSLKKNAEILVNQKKRAEQYYHHIFYGKLNHAKIGQFLGKKAKNMITMLDDIKLELSEDYGDDVMKILKYVRWDLKEVPIQEDYTALLEKIEKDENQTMITHTECEGLQFVSLKFTCKDANLSVGPQFSDMMHRLYFKIEERLDIFCIEEQKEQDQIAEALNFEFDDFGMDMNEGYSPESPTSERYVMPDSLAGTVVNMPGNKTPR